MPPAEVAAFEKEMGHTKVDWQLHAYGGAVHAFTNPEADSGGIPAFAYNEAADRRSWHCHARSAAGKRSLSGGGGSRNPQIHPTPQSIPPPYSPPKPTPPKPPLPTYPHPKRSDRSPSLGEARPTVEAVGGSLTPALTPRASAEQGSAVQERL